MRRSGRPYLGALLACVSAAVASAAAATTIHISPTADLIYDSNIARSSEALAAARGLHRSDLRFTPAIALDVSAPLGGQELFLNADAGRDFYARNAILNRERIAATGGVRAHVARCTATVSGTFSDRQSDLADLLDAGTVKNTERFLKVAADARCGGPIGLVPSFGIAKSWARNSAEIRKRSDYDMNEGHAGIAYTRPTFGELSLVAVIKNLDYLDRATLAGAGGGYKLVSLGGQFQRNIGSRLRGSVALYRTSVHQKLVRRNFTGLTSNALIDFTLKDNLKLQLNWNREVTPANLGFGDYVLSSSVGARADYALSPRLALAAGAGIDKRQTRGELLLPFAQLTDQRRTFGFARVTIKRSDRATADLEVRREVRKAEPAIFDYTSNRVSLSLRLMI